MQDLKKFFGRKTYDDARIEKYERMLQQSSTPNPDLHFKLGRLYQHEKEKIEALKHYEAAAKLYAQTEQHVGALVTYKIISILNPEDHDASANLAHIEFQESCQLTEDLFKNFLEEHGETVPVKSALAKSEHDTATASKPKSRAVFQRARGKREQQAPQANAQFQEDRKQLLDLIEGNADNENDEDFQGHQEFVNLLEKDNSSAFQAPGERVAAAPLPEEEFLIDLTSKDSPPPKQDTPTRETIEELILHNPLFVPLSDAEKNTMIRQSSVRSYTDDATIMRYPSEQKGVFIVVTGEVYLVKESDGCGSRSPVIQVNPGECWGEHTLFERMKTCAFSVMVTNGTSVLEISPQYVTELTQKYSALFEQLKDVCERRWCQNALSFFPLFGDLSVAEQQQLLPFFSEVTIKEGDVIIREGDAGQSMFLITSGDVEVYTTLVEEGDVQIVQTGKSRLFLAKLRAGDCFGEGAFFTNEPRSATVQALTETTLLKLAEGHLQQLLRDHPQIAQKLQQCHQQRLQETMTMLQSAL